ncbi:hypothetical protein ACFL3Q_14285 [Planctomycetota bacterium]
MHEVGHLLGYEHQEPQVENEGILSDVAVENTWVGGSSDLWHDAENWSVGSVPTADDSVIISGIDDWISVEDNVQITDLTCAGSMHIASGTFTITGQAQINEDLIMDRGTTLTVQGASASFLASGYTELNGANLVALNGGELHLPELYSYRFSSNSSGWEYRTFEAEGSGSVLDLSNLKWISIGSHQYSDMQIKALAGGEVDLRQLIEISERDSISSSNTRVGITASGAGSVIDLSALRMLEDASSNYYSYLDSGDGGVIHSNQLGYLRAVSLTLTAESTLGLSNLKSLHSCDFVFTDINLSLPSLVDVYASEIQVDGVHINLSSLIRLRNSSFTVRNGGTADLSSVSYIDGTNLYVYDGVTLSLPSVASYSFASTTTGWENRYFVADGIGSVLSLPNLITLSMGSYQYARMYINALSGGHVELPSLVTIDETGSLDSNYTWLDIRSDGVGSVIDLSSLESFIDASSSGGRSSIRMSDVATIIAPQLRELHCVSLSLDSATWFDVGQLESFRSGELTLSNDNYVFSNLTDAYDTDVTVQLGASADFAVLSALVSGSLSVSDVGHASFGILTDFHHSTLTLTDGGTATLPQAAYIDGASLYVYDGVTLSLPSVASYSFASTTTGWENRYFVADGIGSVLSLPNLITLSMGSYQYARMYINALSGGHVELPSLVTIDETGSLDSNYTWLDICSDGVGSVIDLSSLESFIDANSSGGRSSIRMSDVATIIAPQLWELQCVSLSLGGAAWFDVGQLESFRSGQMTLSNDDYVFDNLTDAYDTDVTVQLGASADFAVLPALVQGSVSVSDGGHASFGALTDFHNSTLTLTGGGTATLPQAADIDGASLYVYNGVTLTLPSVASYSFASTLTGWEYRYFTADGVGSVLSLPNLSTLSIGSYRYSEMEIKALAGGHVELPSLVTIDETGSQDVRDTWLDICSDGVGSVIDLSSLESLSDSSGSGGVSTLKAVDHGKIDIGSVETDLSGLDVYIDALSQITGSARVLANTRLWGYGTIQGNIVNEGIVEPGSSPGLLVIEGDYTQSSNGQLIIELSGTVPNESHDQLEVTGQCNLDGTLTIQLINGFDPQFSDSFFVLDCPDVNGDFAVYEGLDAGSGPDLIPEWGPQGLTLYAGQAKGPMIVDLSGPPAGGEFGQPYMDITFEKPIDPATFTVDDITITVGGAGVAIGIPSRLSGPAETYRILIDDVPVEFGDYAILIGPEIYDFAGDPMNQDGDAVGGELLDDVFTGVVNLTGELDPPVITSFELLPNQIVLTWSDATGINLDSVQDLSSYSLIASGLDGSFDDGNEIDRTSYITGIVIDLDADTVTLTLNDLPFEDEHYQWRKAPKRGPGGAHLRAVKSA